MGLFQSAVTLGDLDKNFTFGVGYGLSFGNDDDGIVPINFSGVTRVSDNISLVSENYLIVGNFGATGILSFGIRFHSRTNNNFLTLSLLRPTEDTGLFLFVPFFSGTIAIN